MERAARRGHVIGSDVSNVNVAIDRLKAPRDGHCPFARTRRATRRLLSRLVPWRISPMSSARARRRCQQPTSSSLMCSSGARTVRAAFARVGFTKVSPEASLGFAGSSGSGPNPCAHPSVEFGGLGEEEEGGEEARHDVILLQGERKRNEKYVTRHAFEPAHVLCLRLFVAARRGDERQQTQLTAHDRLGFLSVGRFR